MHPFGGAAIWSAPGPAIWRPVRCGAEDNNRRRPRRDEPIRANASFELEYGDMLPATLGNAPTRRGGHGRGCELMGLARRRRSPDEERLDDDRTGTWLGHADRDAVAIAFMEGGDCETGALTELVGYTTSLHSSILPADQRESFVLDVLARTGAQPSPAGPTIAEWLTMWRWHASNATSSRATLL